MNKFWTTTLILSSLISAHSIRPASAQDLERSFEDTIPRTILEDDSDFFTFTLENDKFGSGSDRDYTNGVRLTYFNYSANPPHFARVLDDYIPTFKVNETTSTYYSIGQNMYTPKDTSTNAPDPNDRPYAGFLYASAGLTSLSENHIDELEATIGVVGPWSLGEQTQKFVHKVIDSQKPHGWDYQLKNEPALMLSCSHGNANGPLLMPLNWDHLIFGSDRISALHLAMSIHTPPAA